MAWSVEDKKTDTKRTGQSKVVELRGGRNATAEAVREGRARDELRKERNLTGGMEMLDLEFLLGVIEHTKGEDKNDVTMRKLSFDEVIRREQQNTIDSHALTVYAIDDHSHYSKNLQCEAMKELARRTGSKGKDSG